MLICSTIPNGFIFFSGCPSAFSPLLPLPCPSSYVCACVRVCSNFSSLIMALAVANITQPHSSSSGGSSTNSSSNKRSQRPLRYTPLLPSPPPPLVLTIVLLLLRCQSHTQMLSTHVSMYCSNISIPFLCLPLSPAVPPLPSSLLPLRPLVCYCWLFHALSVRFYAHFMFVFLAQGFCWKKTLEWGNKNLKYLACPGISDSILYPLYTGFN